jgi:hypothetical protein
VGDNEDTPVDLRGRDPAGKPSVTRRWWGFLEATVDDLGHRVRQLRRDWRGASPNLRRALAEQTAPELRRLGDWAYGFAAELERYAAGAAEITDD